MKTILAPTDFSPAATTATNYAAELTYRTGSRLVLMHAFHIPIPTSEFPVAMPSMEELEEGYKKRLDHEAKRLQGKYHNALNIVTEVRCGLAVDEIADVAKKGKADLVVAGMQGGGFVQRRLMGSVTTMLMHKLHCPVLSVDADQQFTVPDKIVLACDYGFLANTSVLQPLLELRRLFNSHLLLLHITDDTDKPEHAGEAAEKLKLELKLGSVPHSWYTLSGEDFSIALNAFVAAEQAGWVVMMPRKHNWLDRLLKESHTTEMAYKSNVPLLAVHAE